MRSGELENEPLGWICPCSGIDTAQPTRTELATFSQQNIGLHLLELQKGGYRPLTIVSHGRILRHLARNCNLKDL